MKAEICHKTATWNKSTKESKTEIQAVAGITENLFLFLVINSVDILFMSLQYCYLGRTPIPANLEQKLHVIYEDHLCSDWVASVLVYEISTQ